MKSAIGFGPQHVFHSLRKTVVTTSENAGVPENVVADIVGHDKTTMTYGLYSFANKRKLYLFIPASVRVPSLINRILLTFYTF